MLNTEKRNEKSMCLNQMDIKSQLELINNENLNAVRAVAEEIGNIALAVEAVCKAFENGGRLVYIGAGTSGRIGVIDAAECPPTFGVEYGKVIGIIAGGEAAMCKASESAEDNAEKGIEDVKQHNLSKNDVLVGISASGGAAYITSAIDYANSIGCTTVGITSNKGTKLSDIAKIAICPNTGAEVVTGSTRLKAGTAQKLILNMISTLAFVRSDYVYENLMINLKPTNIKLKDRMVRIVCDILKCDYKLSESYLEQNNWSIPQVIKNCK